MAGLLKDHAPETWFDHDGAELQTPTISGNLKFKYPLHASLRAFVFKRDGFCCQICKASIPVPTTYSGRYAAYFDDVLLVMDHIISRRNGGAHHPDNLQTLCDPCNARKAATIDRLGVQ